MSSTPLSQLDAAEASPLSIVLCILSLLNGLAYGFIDFATDVDTLGGGEVDISTFLSGAALVLSLTGFGFGVPYTVFEKDSNDWTPGDTICVAVWGWSTPSLLLNLATFLSTKYKQRLAKYLTVGPDTVAAIGLIQLAVGIAAATIYSDPDSGYNGFNSAGGIITPIPSIGKLLLLPKNEALMLILGPLDLICDFGSGLCSFAGDI
ncbi:MAG: hypothetical protein JSS02_32495 [Planctomycetes bacterium]|nr:hypothetical protein [Planctomycetota bacterium]